MDAFEEPQLGLARIIDQRLRLLEEKVSVLTANQAADRTATVLAAQTMDKRLEGMNELRDQIHRERGAYVTVPVFTAEMRAHEVKDTTFHEATERKLERLEPAQTELRTLLTVLSTAFDKFERRVAEVERKQSEHGGRFWALGLISIAVGLASFLFTYFHSRLPGGAP